MLSVIKTILGAMVKPAREKIKEALTVVANRYRVETPKKEQGRVIGMFMEGNNIAFYI